MKILEVGTSSVSRSPPKLILFNTNFKKKVTWLFKFSFLVHIGDKNTRVVHFFSPTLRC